MTQNKIILFCYAFVVGIGVAMWHPPPGSAILPLLLLALAALGAALYLAAAGRRAARAAAVGRRLAAALALAGLALGQARYLIQLRAPDRPVGEIRIRGDSADWRGRPLPGGASLLALRAPRGTGATPLTLRLEGALHARYPERDAEGRPRLGADGRWRMIEVRVPQSAEVVVPPNLPRGALIPIEAPFSRVDAVRLSAGGGDLRLRLIRRTARVAEFARAGRDLPPVTILGRVANDPAVYSFKTALTVAPDLIQFQPDGPFFEVERGHVRVTLPEDLPDYPAFARTAAYGNDVWIRGELQLPPAALNPGAFSQRQFLLSQHIEGQMMLRAPRDRDEPPIVAIRPDGGALRRGHPLVAFSLRLRDDLLRVIKHTLPYPNSAFLAAVTLGLRYGLHDAETLRSPAHAELPAPPFVPPAAGPAPLISHEFRAAGINHVLAVSGLHVTIITAMFVGLFSLLRVSRRAYVPVVILILIVFAIITGARPSTLRAVIMNSLFLVTWAYLNHTLRASVLLGVPIAALVILVQNPALLVDPSFSLSFGAILSLALLTQPAYDALRGFCGNRLLALALVLALLTAAMIHNWFLVVSWRFWAPFAAAAAGIFALAGRLARRGVKPIGDYGFEDLPSAVSLFLAAQIAIQIGMMAPLSGYYFQRWASGGAYANLIAIPLIGVILQIALFAGIVGLVPAVGLYAALWLNAANWIFSSLFILLGHYTAAVFPFPFVRKPRLWELAAYYAALGVVVARARLREWARPRWARWPRAARRAAGLGAAAALALLLSAAMMPPRPDGRLRVAVLAVNYGSAILIRTPGGKNLLVDAGHVQTDRGRRNEAEWTILPQLSARRIGGLDALILTGPAPERILGAADILRYARVRYLVKPHDLPEPPALAAARARRAGGLGNALAGTRLNVLDLRPGEGRVMFREETVGRPFRVEIYRPRADATLVMRIVHGDFALLLPSDLALERQAALTAARPPWLRADVVVAPSRGVYREGPETAEAERIAREFYAALGAKEIVFEFGNPRPVLGGAGSAALASHGRHRRVAEEAVGEGRVRVTDRDGAIRIESDGAQWRVVTQAESLAAGDEDGDEPEIGW